MVGSSSFNEAGFIPIAERTSLSVDTLTDPACSAERSKRHTSFCIDQDPHKMTPRSDSATSSSPTANYRKTRSRNGTVESYFGRPPVADERDHRLLDLSYP